MNDNQKDKILMAWSGGKDSSMALWKLQQDPTVEVVGLLTTGNAITQRISMHGVRLELLRKQAKSIGLPVTEVLVESDTYEEYEQKMAAALEECILKYEITAVAFGDIFLEDLRKYREEKMALVGLKVYFPLWGKDTGLLVQEFIGAKFRTILCCVGEGPLNGDFSGVELTQALVQKLPDGVDPCGENGEYHTFCFDGPIFKHPVAFVKGEKIYRPMDEKYLSETSVTKGFWFADLL